jgi:hypothetical protein
MENGVGAFGVPIQVPHGVFRGEDEQFNFAPLCLTSDLIHDWQRSFASADHQAAAFPRVFSSKESGVCPKASRNFLEAFFFRFLTLPLSITTS